MKLLVSRFLCTILYIDLTLGIFGHEIVKREIDPDTKVVCYYANWSVYRQGLAKFTPQNINPYLCTHLIYAFGGIGKDDTIIPFDKYQDLEKGGFAKFAALKTYNQDLKTMLAIGGWNEGSKRFSPLVADSSRRRTFIRSAIRFLRQFNFDGIDMDWEYPTQREGGKPEDRENYARLMAEMRLAFEDEAIQTGRDRLIISMAVPASLEYTAEGFDLAALDVSLDFFNLLAYDYHSAYEPAVNHHSPLFRANDISDFDFRATLNVDETIRYYLSHGASRSKLVLGIPTYGRSYTLINPDAHAIGSPSDGPGEQGEGTKEDGYLAYYEICSGIEKNGWDVVKSHAESTGPYAHKENFWVGYDDLNIVREKAHYVAEEGLGGIMFWTIDNDDFRGRCHDLPYPLIETAKKTLFQSQASFQTKSTAEERHPQANRQTPRKINSSISSFNPLSTPKPPTTPSSVEAFVCKEEGFFPHSSSCKKYFWCLDAPGLGLTAHTFTCPQGLYFNTLTDGCDFKRNVDCGGKSQKDSATTTTTAKPVETSEKEPTLKELLAAIKSAGSVEAFEEQLKKDVEIKKELEQQSLLRNNNIASKTQSRFSQLLSRKRNKPTTETTSVSYDDEVSTSTTSRGGIINSSSFSRRRRPTFVTRNRPISTTTEALSKSPQNESDDVVEVEETIPTTTSPTIRSRLTVSRTPFNRNSLQRNRLQSLFDRRKSVSTTTKPVTPNLEDSSSNGRPIRFQSNRGAFRNRGNQQEKQLSSENSFERSAAIITERTKNRGFPPTLEGATTLSTQNLKYVTIDRSKYERNPVLVTTTSAPTTSVPQTVASVRDLEYVSIERGPPTSKDSLQDNEGSSKGDEESFVDEDHRESLADNSLRTSLVFLTHPELSIDDDTTTETPFYPTVPVQISSKENKTISHPRLDFFKNNRRFRTPFQTQFSDVSIETSASSETDPASSNYQQAQGAIRQTVSDATISSLSTISTTAAQQLTDEDNSFVSSSASVTASPSFSTSPGRVTTTLEARSSRFPQKLNSGPRKEDPLNTRSNIIQEPRAIDLSSSQRISFLRSSTTSVPKTINFTPRPNRIQRPTALAFEPTTAPRSNSSPFDYSSRRTSAFRSTTIPQTPLIPTPTTTTRTQTLLNPRQPTTLRNFPEDSRSTLATNRHRSLNPTVSSLQTTIDSTSNLGENRFIAHPRTLQRLNRPNTNLISTTAFLSPQKGRQTTPSSELSDDEYEYYYEYVEENSPKTDYDYTPFKSKFINQELIPLANKVSMGPNGPTCYDVGTFPHPDSCKKFITCSRRTSVGRIIGWEYECPSNLAFDPVGGRCDWVADVYC